ncbi:hypothetical protein CITRIK5_100103 [Citricoccus sp. K5]|nr:hypothetical protein CITRIK5_100037 [Citricoccus sp. K5]VXA95332.1 hypothetical protein CITRIK5_100103 [Citricoccus sp. K5]
MITTYTGVLLAEGKAAPVSTLTCRRSSGRFRSMAVIMLLEHAGYASQHNGRNNRRCQDGHDPCNPDTCLYHPEPREIETDKQDHTDKPHGRDTGAIHPAPQLQAQLVRPVFECLIQMLSLNTVLWKFVTEVNKLLQVTHTPVPAHKKSASPVGKNGRDGRQQGGQPRTNIQRSLLRIEIKQNSNPATRVTKSPSCESLGSSA